MRLVTYVAAGHERPGVLVPDRDGARVLDLGTTPGLPGTVDAIVADDAALAAMRDLAASTSPACLPALGQVRLAPPVRPGAIWCLGYNYRGHVPDGADPTAGDPPYPDIFVKTPNPLIGPGEPVPLPAAAEHVDYEGEIAVVIGRRAHDVPLDSAMDHVAGYTLFNDVSSRDWQTRSSQWQLGKCFDGFGPLGPWLVTADEVPDFHDLLVQVERDGVLTVSQGTSSMVFALPFLVHYLSQVVTLQPGDVISTGTPQKLPDALAAHRPLAPGDTVTVRVAGLGSLTTTFVDPSADARIAPHQGGRP